MNSSLNDPRHPWARLIAAARNAPDDRGASTPHGFATRVAALALAQERAVVSLVDRFALRAFAVASLLALASVALNYSAITGGNSMAADDEVLSPTDAVAVVFDLAD